MGSWITRLSEEYTRPVGGQYDPDGDVSISIKRLEDGGDADADAVIMYINANEKLQSDHSMRIMDPIQASLWFDYFRDYGKDAAVPDLGDPENDEKMQLTARDSGLVFDGEYSVLFVPILSDKYHVFVLLAAFISYGDDGVVSLTIDYYFPAIRPEVRLSRMVAAALKNVVYAFCWRVRRHNKFWRFRQSEFLPFESLGTRLNFRHHEVPVSTDPNAQGLYMLYAIEALTSQSCWSTWKMLKIDEYREQVLRVAKEWAAKHR